MCLCFPHCVVLYAAVIALLQLSLGEMKQLLKSVWGLIRTGQMRM